MNILILMDSFKANITSLEAGEAVSRGVKLAYPHANVKILPIADGGEGTVDAFVHAMHGRKRTSQVRGPRGEHILATWGLLPNRQAVIELAAASGLPLIPYGQRKPFHTSTYGTGQQIREALDAGCRYILLGLGGSCTHDCGTGILSALGARFSDRRGKPVRPCAANLKRIEHIDLTHIDPRIEKTALMLACDVTNTLCGPEGAAAVFGPQKGAHNKDEIARLEEGSLHFAETVRRCTGQDILKLKGGASAGGVGAGLMGLAGARAGRGIDMLAEVMNLEHEIRQADFIFTGEGRIDSQTVKGKVICGLAGRAKAAGVPIVAIVGNIRGPVGPLMNMGLTAVFSTAPGPYTTVESFKHSRQDLERTASQVMRIVRDTLRYHGKGARK